MDSVKKRKRCTRPICIGGIVVAVAVVAVVIVIVVGLATDDAQDEDPGSPYKAVCSDVEATVNNKIEIRCDFTEDAEIDPAKREKLANGAVDLARTSVSRDDYRCFSDGLDVVTCQGPTATCSSGGQVKVAMFDKQGQSLLVNDLEIKIVDKKLTTSIHQNYTDVGVSYFTMTCSIRDACEDYSLGLFGSQDGISSTRMDGNNDNAGTTCNKTYHQDTGASDIECTSSVMGDVISNHGRHNLSCSLLNEDNDVIKQSRIFELPSCKDYTNGCCTSSTPNVDDCQETCSVFKSCLLPNRYQTFSSSSCSEICVPQWCRTEQVVDNLVDSVQELLNIVCT